MRETLANLTLLDRGLDVDGVRFGKPTQALDYAVRRTRTLGSGLFQIAHVRLSASEFVRYLALREMGLGAESLDCFCYVHVGCRVA